MFSKERLRLSEMEQRLWACQVSFRSGAFPLIQEGPATRGIDYIEHSFSSVGFAFYETWRFYQSGQFVFYRALSEDWSIEAGLSQQLEKGIALSILPTLYLVSEVFEFSARLAQQGILAPEGFIQINLIGTKGRQLVHWGDPFRPLFKVYVCDLEELLRTWTLTGEKIIAEGRELSFEHFLWIMERFGYDANPEAYKPDQEKFFRRQI
ncbi:MAG TPA: hypothetical protein VEF34_10875 [Syntrophobacteraceae bacterium]|nr:hypothetical protein [Syntrophobacteraceae bacterium]